MNEWCGVSSGGVLSGSEIILTHSPVRVAPYLDKPFLALTGASDFAVCAVLTKRDYDGIEHPVGYFTKKPSVHQRQYYTFEKEAVPLAGLAL